MRPVRALSVSWCWLLCTAIACAPSGVLAQDAADPLERFGLRASDGAAAGYLPDAACGRCHADKQQSFAEVGMAQSFARPRNAPRVEDYERAAHHHAASDRHYRMEWRGEELWFRRYQLDGDGSRINEIELRVDWVLGSGNRARSYLHQTAAGELYQLPIGWYTQAARWDMSPGFEAADHAGVERQVRRECLFCHNAYPQVAAGSDRHDRAHLFPQQLPEGIGCQRCHGPGAEHVRAVLGGQPPEAIRAAVVNPARLDWARRNDVCFQCHLLPAVEAIGPRRMGRGDYAYRPGEPLSDYMVHVDIDQAAQPRGDRFQINHHAYRLQQSACFIGSEGQMGCTTCHDPHVKHTGGRAPEHFRQRCLQCHQPHAQTDTVAQRQAQAEDVAIDACVSCHMPQRRTQDVVLVTMTDHRIARGPFDSAQLTAPLAASEPRIDGIELLQPGSVSSQAEREAYRALAALRAGAVGGALDHLHAQLLRMTGTDPGWWFELARYRLMHRQFEAALAALERLAAQVSGFPASAGLRAHTLLGLGRNGEAQRIYASAHARDLRPEDHYNRGLAWRAEGEHARAAEAFRQVVAQRPLLAAAWYQLGMSSRTLGRMEDAREAFEQALRVHPDLAAARSALQALDGDRGQ